MQIPDEPLLRLEIGLPRGKRTRAALGVERVRSLENQVAAAFWTGQDLP
jgi:hypothetical protein